MNTFADQHRPSSNTHFPFIWWAGYFFVAVWAQEYSGGKDFLTPAVLVCLQTRQWWSAGWLAILCIFMHEGVGNLEFGISVLFYAGMLLLYVASHWLLEPKSPLFIFLYAFFLAVWLHGIVLGGIAFQEMNASATFSWTWISVQWACYLVWWPLTLWACQAWVRHGRS